MGSTATPTTALAQQPASQTLFDRLGNEYGMDSMSLEQVLLRTVFPQGKAPTIEQMNAFCTVALHYKLNPMTREIYAFPSKGGGIIPVLGVDGWITLVQRQPKYDGHEFVEQWADKVGGTLLAVTCIIYRRDFGRPVKMTEWMSECSRETDQWRLKPVRMLTHKAFIQAARYAFGLSGVYDQDEADRILEAEDRQQPTPVRQMIAMPQRVQQAAAPVVIEAQRQPQTQVQTQTQTHTGGYSENLEAEPAEDDAPVEEQMPPAAANAGPAPQPFTGPGIGRGRAQRIHAILNTRKKRTEQDLHEMYLKPLGLEHLSDLPLELNDEVARWAEGPL